MPTAEYQREWRQKNPDSCKAAQKRFREKNRDSLREKAREKARVRRAADPEGERLKLRKWISENTERVKRKRREQLLRTKYNLTIDQWETLFEGQNRRCAICKSDSNGDPRDRWHTDHCHTSGKVRGILCHHCNNMLGAAKDSPDTLRTAIEYLGA